MSLAQLKGVTAYLIDSQGISVEAAAEDQDEEVESLLNSFDVDNKAACGTLHISTNETDTLPSKYKRTPTAIPVYHDQLSASLETASAGVIDFCVTINKVVLPDDVDGLYPNLSANFPMWIALWIMNKCDENDIWTSKAKPLNFLCATYGTAQKMRAAVSHKFGHDHKLGTQPWSEHPTIAGKISESDLCFISKPKP
ncbi:uncharacterized protein F5147DRAFT_651178 [Suillus discolor]|uniref:Uncharacterized protein n=1 Tax=Suillus discolor TaxID=1912936 RepID=A0A9P7JVW6_9AGAM|nr:uncharacterized protein F5147DRAFT_651178 [Suillus discolor]KAG2111497.1 hypothetical protein F5147DRAFT_651178 [Suillus discolor]